MHQVPFMLLTDGYKVDHRRQYPEGTTRVFTNMTPRKGRDTRDTGVVFFGLRAAIQKYLIDYANETFFSRPVEDVVAEYDAAMLDYLGPNGIGTDHIRSLHALGYLPLEIRAVPEGTFVPYGVPVLTIENTVDEFYWVTNYIETLFSSALWQAITSATTAFKYRKELTYWANFTGAPVEFVDWQAHDFSFRGMSSLETAEFSGAAHLTSFTGTDTIPAIHFLKHYYDAEGLIGGSVPATEHSVMCAGGRADELGTFERLLDLYPTGIVSVVSDTWDLWKVLTEYLPALKDKILARDGKLVIRPDSGDPVDIICGDMNATIGSPQRAGVVRLLAEAFGTTLNDHGFHTLNPHVGCIYGDSITGERANQICSRLADQGFSSDNIVFGVGSYTYQFNTRDTHGFALKATWAQVNGQENLIYKDPVTDDGTKKSALGRMIVDRTDTGLVLRDGLTFQAHRDLIEQDVMRTVFLDGELTVKETLAEIRARVLDQV